MEIGIIGTGDMGKLYAREFSRNGYRINCSDVQGKRGQLEKELAGTGIHIYNDGVEVSRRSDIIFYLVPVESIERTVAQCGPSTRKYAIVSSGTSVMTPAVEAFETYLPDDVSIINWHWLFGPSVKPQNRGTALVNHRSTWDSYKRARDAFETVGTKVIELPSYKVHDKITADTQAVTHIGFEAMGTAWKNMGSYPWDNTTYAGGIDKVKISMCLRIYCGKSHVYAGLAIFNPFAREQIKQYADSVSDLFGLMIQENEGKFRKRIEDARKFIFGNGDTPILLDERVMAEFGLGISSKLRTPNSHLSPLAMADAWTQAKINPYQNLVCQTPVFRLRLGIVEYLLKNNDLLEESIETALHEKNIRRDDLEFQNAVREWATIVVNRDTAAYHNLFKETKDFFEGRLEDGMKQSTELIERMR